MKDVELWKNIAEHYAEMSKALWNPEHKGHWSRDEDKGMYHLWQAYYLAKNAEEKDDLLYARILTAMHWQMMYKEDDHTLFRKYVSPAKEAYDRAIANGEKVTDKELERLKYWFESLQYKCEMEKNTYDNWKFHESQIEGFDRIPHGAFAFHDSFIKTFELRDTEATLKLEYEGNIVTFEIEGINDLKVIGDQHQFWVSDFYCYPAFYNNKLKVFDIGFIRVDCDRIAVTDIQLDDRTQKKENP